MNNPLLLNIAQLVTASECIGSLNTGVGEDPSLMPEAGFIDLLTALMSESKSGEMPDVVNSDERLSTNDPLFQGVSVNDLPLQNLWISETLTGGQDIAGDRPVRMIPVDMVINPEASVSDEQINTEVLKLFDSLHATLQITYGIDRQATTCDVVQPNPEPTEAQPVVVLKLESNDVNFAIPVEVADSVSLITEKSNHQHFTLKLVDSTRLILTEASHQPPPCDEQFEITSRPEIAVRQVVFVTDPVKLIKHLMSDVTRPDGRQPFSSPQPNQVVQPNEQLSVPIRISGGGSPNTTGNNEPGQDDNRSDFKKKTFVDRIPEASTQRLSKLDTQRLAREWNSEIDRCARISIEAQVSESSDREFEAALKPVILHKPVSELASELKGAFRSGHSEPVKFHVHLPDIGLKLAEISSFRVSLQPQDLGNVRVHLVMVADRLTARLTVESPAAVQAVEANLPALKETLVQHGIKVEYFTVDVANGESQDRERNSRKNDSPGLLRGKKLRMAIDESTQVSIQPRSSTSGRNLSGAINLVA